MTDWQPVLLDASRRVQKVADAAFRGRKRSEILGTGASGDKTLFVDRRAESELINALSAARDVRLLSEEKGETGPKHARYLAVLDPIDGSSNFSRGVPFYCTSICIFDGRRFPDSTHALVRNLINGDVYYAERGMGATKNGRRIQTSRVARISDAVGGVDISATSRKVVDELAPLLAALKRQVHFGANALELCLVADGLIDAFIDVRGKMRVTDIAAAYLIAREAGAVVTTKSGEEPNPALNLSARFDCVATANASLHAQVLSRLNSFK